MLSGEGAMLSILLSLTTVAVAPAPPPPPPMVLPSPVSPRFSAMSRDPGPSILFDVEVRAGGDLLWNGPMRVNGITGSSVNRSKSDAPSVTCPTVAGYDQGVRSSLSVNLSEVRFGDPDADRFQLRVALDRPGGTADGCVDGERSSRSVGMTENLHMTAGETRTLEGDGGLQIKLHRH
ncbi:hypothetical protein [Sphingomonas abietis]|uniref:Uncharacterized protein n=1 Tax=Sphingomonas abietis TaxID=3012344 RepID=A0ABY7NRL1_9SPHN|nr:hypothetical protein [Sphingomonas abietis]WBO24175.1 hypothetical protein PBT88_08750 [Sphingomonas abietis]